MPKSIKGVDGQPVNALLGTANAVLAAIAEYSPRAVVMCDGAEAATYRVEAFPGYHAAREPMPEPLAWQFERGGELWASLGWHPTDAGDLEADDLMATLAAQEQTQVGTALILTGDRDLLQCVTDSVRVLLLKPGKSTVEIGPSEVVELLGVTPQQVPDLIALRGDPSDGIPGAPGIGAKTAARLLAEFGDLEGVIAAADQQSPKVAESLTTNAELLRSFRDVATVRSTGNRQVEDCATDLSSGAEAAEKLGMNRLAARLRA